MNCKKYSDRFLQAISCCNGDIQELLMKLPFEVQERIQEIRIRADKPICLISDKGTYFLTYKGMLVDKLSCEQLVVTKMETVFETFKTICNHSIYTYHEDIRNGYITIKGGHRVGICGTAVVEDAKIKSIKDISSLNIRIARQIEVVTGNFMKEISNGDFGVLIVGAPSSGKTTILRDIAKSLSIGKFGVSKKVSVIDERGEIAGVYFGRSCNDVGLCDVLNGYPKGEGLIHAIRSLSPEVAVCDEIGRMSDLKAIEEGVNAGVKLIASIHAGGLNEFLKRNQTMGLLKTGAFEKIVILADRKTPGIVKKIYGVDEIYAKSHRINYANSFRSDDRIYGVT